MLKPKLPEIPQCTFIPNPLIYDHIRSMDQREIKIIIFLLHRMFPCQIIQESLAPTYSEICDFLLDAGPRVDKALERLEKRGLITLDQNSKRAILNWEIWGRDFLDKAAIAQGGCV